MKPYVTIRDLLQRKHFEKIEVIAGKEGLNRQVKWVHVVDVIKIRNLLNGHELILSTGVAWKDRKDSFISLVEQLIESDAAGLCIEFGTYTSSIPQEIIDIANKHQFPIILFRKEVPFVEITQDIHTLLINHQYQMISDLENYSQALNKKLLTMKHYSEILTFIQQFLKVQVVILFNNKEMQFIPNVVGKERQSLLNLIEKAKKKSTHIGLPSVTKVPIQLLGDHHAEVIIISKERALSEFEQLILDRTSTALAQFMLRELYVEERRKTEEAEWIHEWLEGEQNEESINEYLAFHLPSLRIKGAVVLLYKLDTLEQYSKIDLTYFHLYFRTIFEQHGFSIFGTVKRNLLIFIMLNKRSLTSWKQRVNEGIQKLRESDIMTGASDYKPCIGVGKYVHDLTKLHISYQTALETLRIQNRGISQSTHYFYDDLHIYRLISLLNQQQNLQELVMEYLEPVLEYDKKYHGKLMETLKTYLACNGSKQETAKRLYVVRQTLYHRIQKLEKLLGSDFMEHEKRIAIEFMIYGYEFLMASKKSNRLEKESF